jgi:hypothetical protein
MAFSCFVEFLNLRMRRRRTAPVKLHKTHNPVSGEE